MLSLVRKVTTHKWLMHFVLCIYEESTKEGLSASGRLVSGVLWSVQARMLLTKCGLCKQQLAMQCGRSLGGLCLLNLVSSNS